jgi:ubiquinone/menaquinone biosynthesis C-methylase UbiE
MTVSPADSQHEQVAAKARMVRMYDEIAPTYGSVVDLPSAFGRALVAAARLKPGDRVLDIGCGRGACLRPAADAVGPDGSVHGIDVSPEMIALLTRELQRDYVTNAHVRLGDADLLDVAPGAFDAVTCGLAVHHFANLTVTLTACRLALRSGGHFGASTFADGGPDFPWVLDALAETDAFPALRGQSQQHRTTGAAELRHSLTEAGFESITTTSIEQRFVFTDAAAHMTWIRTHGLGTTINRLQPEHLQVFIDACARRIEQHRADDGYELIKSVDLTIARRP